MFVGQSILEQVPKSSGTIRQIPPAPCLQCFSHEIPRLHVKHGEIELGSHADQWLTWAHQHADRLDPLRSG